MKMRLMPGAAAVMLLLACDSGGQSDDAGGMVSVAPPDSAACADAPQLRQRASDERRSMTSTSSDQTRVVLGSRANFYASLAVVSDLQCTVTDEAATAALQTALQTARVAGGTTSFYDQVNQWAEANFAATRAIEILVRAAAHAPAL